jgi:hypothetical protein
MVIHEDKAGTSLETSKLSVISHSCQFGRARDAGDGAVEMCLERGVTTGWKIVDEGR